MKKMMACLLAVGALSILVSGCNEKEEASAPKAQTEVAAPADQAATVAPAAECEVPAPEEKPVTAVPMDHPAH